MRHPCKRGGKLREVFSTDITYFVYLIRFILFGFTVKLFKLFSYIFWFHFRSDILNDGFDLKMLSLSEHVGFAKAHDAHAWWIYDARMTSPKTCPVCLSLDGTHYRGDEIEAAFPYHLHMAVNRIKAKVHRFCRCVLRWAGRSRDVLSTPLGLRKKPEKPQLRKQEREPKAMSASQHFLWWKITKYARETLRRR